MFSSTVSLRNTDASCGRYDSPSRARRWIGSRLIDEPSSSIVPPSVGTSPTIM